VADFASSNLYHHFSTYVMRKARHLLDEKNQYFLEASLKRTVKIAASTPLWRAVHDLSWRTEPILDDDLKEIDSIDVEAPAVPDRMKPFRDRAAEGHMNPKGIPCLYLCTNMETAMTEVGSYVSAAQFVLVRDAVVVDCTQDGPEHRPPRGMEASSEKRERSVVCYQ
jgi:RES domain